MKRRRKSAPLERERQPRRPESFMFKDANEQHRVYFRTNVILRLFNKKKSHHANLFNFS